MVYDFVLHDKTDMIGIELIVIRISASGTKPLPDQILAQTYIALWHHWATLSLLNMMDVKGASDGKPFSLWPIW